MVANTCGAITNRPSCSTGFREQGREARAKVGVFPEQPRTRMAGGEIAPEKAEGEISLEEDQAQHEARTVPGAVGYRFAKQRSKMTGKIHC